MSYKIIVSPIASKNIDNAVTYYLEEVSKKVANDFLKDYKKTYKALQKNPFFQFHDNNYLVTKFEFVWCSHLGDYYWFARKIQ